MAKRLPKATQAELERAIRALKNVGLEVYQIVARADCFEIKTSPPMAPQAETAAIKPKPVL